MNIDTKPTESDYRAWLAFLWTIATFAVVAYAMHNTMSVQDILSLAALFLPLDAVFIQSYFKSKE